MTTLGSAAFSATFGGVRVDVGVMTGWGDDTYGSGTPPWLSQVVWAQVVAEVRGHRERGFGALLTEDAVRFCAARAGVDVARLRVEVPHPELKGARISIQLVSCSIVVDIRACRRERARH